MDDDKKFKILVGTMITISAIIIIGIWESVIEPLWDLILRYIQG